MRMRLHCVAGTKVVLDYSETLDAAGNFRQQIRGRNRFDHPCPGLPSAEPPNTGVSN